MAASCCSAVLVLLGECVAVFVEDDDRVRVGVRVTLPLGVCVAVLVDDPDDDIDVEGVILDVRLALRDWDGVGVADGVGMTGNSQLGSSMSTQSSSTTTLRVRHAVRKSWYAGPAALKSDVARMSNSQSS